MRHMYRQAISAQALAAYRHPLSVLRGVNDYARSVLAEQGLVKGPMHSYRQDHAGMELVCFEWEGFEP